MEKETYDRIWNNIIVPIYTNISNNDFYMYFNKSRNKKKIFQKYNIIRDEFKKKYMDDSEVNIDRHKIASVMMAAIEEVYPIKISKKYVFQLWKNKEELDARYVYANETLAFFTALSIIENYKEYGIDGKIELKRKTIVLPETFNESDYAMNTCIDLYFSKRSKNINILTFSNVFFLLEKMSILNDISITTDE
ncbi:hypothetical protein [Blautia luti]|uniref:hypothetical protein n=1 Tax=Blautia luti TaxID=89014 RepID=UPI003D7B90EB